jgi:ribokinase
MFDIISIGSAVLDGLLKSSQFPLNKNHIGGKIEVEEMLLVSGGGGTNTAAGFSRLGLKTACVARFGDDLFGHYLLEDLEKETFDKKYLIPRKGDNTDYSTILVNPDGSRTILVYRGKTRIEETTFPWESLSETKWLYIASIEGNVDLLVKVIDQAKEKGVLVALNPGSRELKDKEKLQNLFPKIEALILNREEAEMFGTEGIINSGTKIVVVTNGKQGAKLYSRELKLFAESFSEPALDETGAGDAFSSGFVSGIVKGFSLEKALKLGMSNGHSDVLKLGGKAGLLYENEIDLWMDKKLKIEQFI